MKVFDLHCHPTLKPLLSLQQNRVSPWDEIDNLANKIFDSQSNCEQLLDGSCNLACVGLMAIETAFLKDCMVRAVAGPVRYVDKQQIDQIASAEPGFTYEDLFIQEIDSIINNPVNPQAPFERVRWIKSMDEYDSDDMKTLFLIASQEGGHGIYYGRNEHEDINKMINKIKNYRKGVPVRILYFTLVHISQNIFANHAYAIKSLKKKPFFPKGNGITPEGHKVIKTLLSDNLQGKPVLIDIKHLSLVSRIQFYENYSTKPIIASHVAVTGCSYKDKPIFKIREKKAQGVFKVKYERRKGYLPETYFNPNSINLYDEDIQAILQSGGLIGLILDERVLGYSNRDKCKEFVSKDEFSKFLSPDDSRVDFPMMSDDEDIQDDLEDVAMEYEEESLMAGYGGLRSFTKKRIHLLHLLNNIMHIIKVGNKLEGIDASKHISIGSDFDGLINAIDVCPSAEEYEDLKRELSLFIDVYASDLIPNSVMFVNDMFYNNGVNFLNNNFNS